MTLGLLAAVVFLAFVAEATVGFGATVVTVALGAFLYPLDVLLPAFVPLNIVLSTYLVVRYRSEVDLSLLLRRILPLMGLALPFGMLLFGAVEDRPLKIAFGVFVVVLSTIELVRAVRRSGDERPLHGAVRVVLLLLGGLVHGLFATGGPMAVYVAGREITEKGAFRATLASLWLLLNLSLVVGYAIGGNLTLETGRISLVLIVPLGLGMLAGEWLHRRVRPSLFRGLLFGLLLLAGLLLALAS
jgi:hypothetical protein